MKPSYIKMSAFGSYAGEEKIDFKGEGINHGIFLITGDTGAGKTTIFDAITFALFDRTSGDKRDGEMMQSQFSDGKRRTFVEFEFVYRNETYRILRYPKQMRESKRKNKDGEYAVTTDAPSVELILPDGTVFKGKKKETDEKIVEIIGLTFEQFTQIAMIAQGDFLKLLHAPSKERKAIFERIFNTRIYWQIEEELKNRRSELYGKLEDNRKDIMREVASIRLVPDSQYKEGLESLPEFLESRTEELLSFLAGIQKESKEKEGAAAKEAMALQQEIDRINEEIQKAEGLNQIFERLRQERLKQEELALKKDSIDGASLELGLAEKAQTAMLAEQPYIRLKKDYQEIQKKIADTEMRKESFASVLSQKFQEKQEAEQSYQKKGPGLITEISRLEASFEAYVTLEKKREISDGKKHEFSVIQKRADAFDKMEERLREEEEKLLKEQEVLAGQLKKEPELSVRIDLEKKRKAGLAELERLMQELAVAQNRYALSEESARKAKETEDESIGRYDLAYRDFIHNQAGILAAALQEGEACPVCGALSHPAPAIQVRNGVSEQQLEQAKARMDKASALSRQYQEKRTEARHAYELVKAKAEGKGIDVTDSDFSVESADPERIRGWLQEVSDFLKNAEAQMAELRRAAETQEKNSQRLLLLKSEKQEAEEQGTRLAEAKKELEKEILTLAVEMKSLQQGLQFGSCDAAKAEHEALIKQRRNLEESKNRFEKEYEAALRQDTDLKGQLKSQMEQNAQLQTAVCQAEEEFSNVLRAQGFESPDSYREAIRSAEQIAQLRKVIQEYGHAIVDNNANLRNYCAQTEGKEPMDTKELCVRKQETELKKEQADTGYRDMSAIRQNNDAILHKVRAFYHSRSGLIEAYKVVGRLSDTANGKLSGRHMTFQTYIQRRYFKMILHEANKRLLKMSSGQFLLQCRDIEALTGAAESGLELDVCSLMNSSCRDVKTLSGGESFTAALAMALGMADIIQNTAGSIRIDTMFIDEGFGSLSEETRTQAIDILNDLSEGKRLVGIISHVTELKAQIGTKLVVTKDKSGSRTHWEKE